MQPIWSPSMHPTPERSMARLEIWDSSSSLIPPGDFIAMLMWTSQESGTRIPLRTIRVPPSHEVSQVALSTTKAEYIALSQALCDVIQVMSILGEMREHKFNVISVQPRIYCKAFENNSGAL
ncbi:hypothetical protein ACHAW6_006221 [Cyclotella cf. meneghiniana]